VSYHENQAALAEYQASDEHHRYASIDRPLSNSSCLFKVNRNAGWLQPIRFRTKKIWFVSILKLIPKMNICAIFRPVDRS
jgi:hypothetical protein